MKTIFLFFIVLQLTSCLRKGEVEEIKIVSTKIEAFNVLKNNHDLLHMMLDADKEKGLKAFKNFKKEIQKINNIELIPIDNAVKRIKNFELEDEKIINLDELVDYYQSGLSMQIESIFKGYGVNRIIPSDSALILYKKISL